MRKLIPLLFITLLLAGCVIDTTAQKSPKPDLQYSFEIKDILVQPGSKMYQLEGLEPVLYTAYTTQEQAAYLKSNMPHLRAKLNNKVHSEKVEVIIGERQEYQDAIYYELEIQIYLDEKEAQKLGETITELTLSIVNKQLFTTKHSRISVQPLKLPYELWAEFASEYSPDRTYEIIGDAMQQFEINELYVEGSNGERYYFSQFPQVIQSNKRTHIIVPKSTYDELNIQTPHGIYAVLADGTEQLLGVDFYTSKKLKETMWKQLLEN